MATPEMMSEADQIKTVRNLCNKSLDSELNLSHKYDNS